MANAALAPIVLAELPAAATRPVPGPVGFDGGAVGAFGPYGGGRKVPGAKFRHDVEVVVATVRPVAEFGRHLPELGTQVRHRVIDDLTRATGDDRPVVVDITVTDVVLPFRGSLGWGSLAAERATAHRVR